MAGLSIKSCHAPAPVFSSCQHLLGSTTKRRLIFLFCLMSLIGNLVSLIVRHCCHQSGRTTNDATGVFVSNLNVCDCVMGVYLAMLAVADQLLGGDYLWRERSWRVSTWCTLSGFLFMLSSEVSVFIICIVTFERCWVVSGFKCFVTTKKVSTLLYFISWMSGLVLASIPAAWTTFSSSGACIPSLVPVPGQHRVHHYAIGVLAVLNCLLMSMVVCGQAYIFKTVSRNKTALLLNSKGSKDLVLALRVMTISVTDACSWFLVAMMMSLTSRGFLESVDVSFTSTVFIMVKKPWVNPLLYLVSVSGETQANTAATAASVAEN